MWTANLGTVYIVCKQLHNGCLLLSVHGFTPSWICSSLRVVQMCTLYACTSLSPPLGARGHSVSLLALTIHIPAILILTTLCKSIICNNYSLICSHCMKNLVYYGYAYMWHEMTLLHIFIEMYTYKDVAKQ